MSIGFYNVPVPKNEPVKSYAPGSSERIELQDKIKELRATLADLPMIIDGKEVRSGKKTEMYPPHDLAHHLGCYHQGDKTHVEQAIEAALKAKSAWENMPWQHRAAIFLKAADLISGPFRARMNAATMLGQSKNAYQAEIDAACELADFYRFGVKCMTDIYSMQPESNPGMWNYNEFRPLEGFVFALTPFNFTSIAGNLPVAPVMLGNVSVWKPAKTAVYSASVIMEVLMEAGLPAGVINLVFVSGPVAGDVIFSHPDFAGIHFTGSTGVFQDIWKTIGANISRYKSYPRIVGETGGKDFIFADPTADTTALATAIVRGSFEYQGQKCSAASRVYMPRSIWEETWSKTDSQLRRIKMGPPEDFTNFVNAVIDEASFDKLKGFIDRAMTDEQAEVISGGKCDKTKGYFVEPTVILAKDPHYITMQEELFGPVVTIYVYEDDQMEQTLTLLDETSLYALTGAIFSQNRYAIDHMTRRLANAAGNFYINDKPTGAVVGQQPFGGARGSGTNDKAGSVFNMLRWVSIRTIKETFIPARDFVYPSFLPDK
ncbi:MAG: L-glutamate gamma-semialdehyde dehydrogenase [Prolixibacteraceae bacterium]